MNIAALQINALGLSPNRLDYYFRIAAEKEVKLLLLGEYVLNPFFKELINIPLGMLAQQSESQIKLLRQLSTKYGISVVAPIVRVVKKEPKKLIAIVHPGRVSYYEQQILINYKHWNEEKFFANEVKELVPPPVFRLSDLRFGVLAGFEIHFDFFWQSFIKKDVDVVLVPTVSTFGSQQRWQELLKMRAFTSNLQILRANRIGEYKDELGLTWKFYGESLSVLPDGKISTILGENEEMLIESVSKELIKSARREWGFRSALKKRGMV